VKGIESVSRETGYTPSDRIAPQANRVWVFWMHCTREDVNSGAHYCAYTRLAIYAYFGNQLS